jgi:hypothetical protein
MDWQKPASPILKSFRMESNEKEGTEGERKPQSEVTPPTRWKPAGSIFYGERQPKGCYFP